MKHQLQTLGGGGGITLYKCQYSDVPLAWLRFSQFCYIHGSQMCIFSQNFCNFGICMGCKLPIFANFQLFWYIDGSQICPFSQTNTIWSGIVMGPIWKSPVAHPYPIPGWVAPLPKHLQNIYRVAQKKRNSQYSRFFRTLLWSTVIFFTLLNRASFPHYNNTKIIKFGWELFILWVISYGRFAEFRGTINDKLMANPENDSP